MPPCKKTITRVLKSVGAALLAADILLRSPRPEPRNKLLDDTPHEANPDFKKVLRFIINLTYFCSEYSGVKET